MKKGRYDITNRHDQLDVKKYMWLKKHLVDSQYKVVNDGYLIDAYYVDFIDPAAETLFVLRWL